MINFNICLRNITRKLRANLSFFFNTREKKSDTLKKTTEAFRLMSNLIQDQMSTPFTNQICGEINKANRLLFLLLSLK